ncbi:FAD-dependent oxidoreductase [Terrabacter sp. Ter38]|uniref:FAD-dependent oxidoreductase n=1 Tax=Terrabacter sp. Ter38 TaxID=2926030 RepID=UPI0021185693|nr:FAD-dependent oxidoreductase [Terrabacter sp. Ter38]
MSSTETHQVETLVVGGGIAGLATALGLARQGRAVHVIERAERFGEVGAGIQLAPNAMAVLDSLGVMDAIMQDAVLPQKKRYLDAVTGEEIATIDLGPQFVERYGYPYVVTHRADLHGALLRGCRDHELVTLETDRAVTGARNLDDGRAGVECADGMIYVADAVIGADGLRSAVRPLVVDDATVPSEYVAYRGTVPVETVSAEAAQTPTVLCWLGPQMHLIQYPLRGGKLYNNVAVFRSEWYSPDHDDWGTEAELDARFARCCTQVQQAGRYLNRDIRWPMYDREPISTWTQGAVTLIGDAAHPMLQYLAQGGAQSLDDSLALVEAMVSEPSAHAAFRRYEAQRAAHTGTVQRLARVAGELFHIDGVGRALRNAAFADHDPTDYTSLDWMFMPWAKAGPSRSYPY